jgi:hypothetical protein
MGATPDLFLCVVYVAPISFCHNPSLELATKAKACKGTGQEGSPGVWECVRMNTHTPKWAPILGVGVLVDSRIFKKWL